VAGDIKLGSQVARGQRLGLIGDSGNAAGGTAHLHFEIHSTNGDRLNPYRSLLAAQGGQPEQPSRSASGAGPTATLSLGDRGAAVAAWQRELNRTRPGNPIETDGIFGPRTEHATSIFQRQVGLGPDGLGVVGPQTRAALERYVRREAAGRTGSASSPAGSATLRLGSRGAGVVRWQRALNAVADAGLVTDGVFGPRTHAATVAFQRAAGLGPDGLGLVGSKTRAAMATAR
jgi:peptidoglycan hydrolase-like protein with peptidoglycan-binding domain